MLVSDGGRRSVSGWWPRRSQATHAIGFRLVFLRAGAGLCGVSYRVEVVADVVALVVGRPRRQVVVTFPLSAGAARHLSDRLGEGFDLVDIRVSVGDEDVVLMPPSSRQLTGKLRAAFPDAALLAVEVEDTVHGVSLGGQVLRTLDAGADGYFVARSMDELASIVDQAAEPIDGAEASAPVALTAGEADELSDLLDALLVERQAQHAAVRKGEHGSGDIS